MIIVLFIKKFNFQIDLFSLPQVIDQIKGGYFSQGNPNEFKDIVDNLLYHDRFLTLADYESYIAAQDKVSDTYKVSYQNEYCWRRGLNSPPFRTLPSGPRWPS